MRLREEKADDAARSLSEATRALAAARTRVTAEREARARLERALDGVRAREHAALEAGALSVGDLAQAAKWEIEDARSREAARAAEERATSEAHASEAHVVASRGVLAGAKADADAASSLVAKARARELAKEIASQEEASEEAFAARARSRA